MSLSSDITRVVAGQLDISTLYCGNSTDINTILSCLLNVCTHSGHLPNIAHIDTTPIYPTHNNWHMVYRCYPSSDLVWHVYNDFDDVVGCLDVYAMVSWMAYTHDVLDLNVIKLYLVHNGVVTQDDAIELEFIPTQLQLH